MTLRHFGPVRFTCHFNPIQTTGEALTLLLRVFQLTFLSCYIIKFIIKSLKTDLADLEIMSY